MAGYDRGENAVKTWRYLRIAMVLLVVGLGAAIAIEAVNVARVADACLQTSISAYYYTPVRGFFVGALLAIGVCLVCLKGNTDTEDVLLNLAGAFAPIVALVPTPGTGDCASRLGTDADRDLNVGNNVPALLVVGALGLVVVTVLVAREQRAETRRLDAPASRGLLSAVVLWAVATGFYFFGHELFLEGAHFTAAVLMFVCIYFVVRSNARSADVKPSSRRLYDTVRWSIVGSAGVVAAFAALGWQHWIFGIEAALILLFAVFWTVQTEELWNQGLR